MTRTRPRLLAAAAAALPLLVAPLALAAPAGAATLSHHDQSGDVRYWDFANLSKPHRVADHTDADLTGFTVDYRPRLVRVTETFRALDHSAPRLAVGGTFKLPSGKTHDLILRAGRGNWDGTARLRGVKDCALTSHLDYTAGTATIVVPASCLGRPAWVRFQADALTTDSMAKPSYFYIDVAPGKNPLRDNGYSRRILRGPATA